MLDYPAWQKREASRKRRARRAKRKAAKGGGSEGGGGDEGGSAGEEAANAIKPEAPPDTGLFSLILQEPAVPHPLAAGLDLNCRGSALKRSFWKRPSGPGVDELV